MALPCLGYLFETDSLCMCCTSCLYPLIRHRCGPLGSHQASKKLHPPSFFPPILSHSLLPAKMLQRMVLLPCLLPRKGHITRGCQRTEREAVQSAKASVLSNHMEKRERQQRRGGVFHQSEGERKGQHQSTLWVTELELRRT